METSRDGMPATRGYSLIRRSSVKVVPRKAVDQRYLVNVEDPRFLRVLPIHN